MLRVDLGGIGRDGEWKTVNTDVSVRQAPDFVADITAHAHQLESIFQPESIDIIRCIHTLEHLPNWDILPTLEYWRRFLKTGGKLWIVVPDLGEMAKDYASGRIPFEVFAAVAYVPPSRTINRPATEEHRWGWSYDTLCQDLLKAGYSRADYAYNDVWIDSWSLDYSDLVHTGLVGKYNVPNLRVEAVK